MNKVTACALAGCLWLWTAAAAAYDFKTLYTHYSDGEQLSSVLSDFARVQGLQSRVSPALHGVLSGRFRDEDPNRFMQGMKAAFGVGYYQLNGTMVFYHDSEWQENTIKPANLSAENLKNQLIRTGMVARELPLEARSGLLFVSGPADYVSNISAMATNMDNAPEVQRVMRVFRLKHARADDTEIKSMDKTLVVPGVASILSRMVSGGGSQYSGSGPTVIQNAATVDKLRGTGLAALGKSGSSGSGAQTQTSTPGSAQTQQAGIMADSRLNAVVINDLESRMPFYKKVIADLDQPVKLVELHAAIVDIDINASRDLGIAWQAARQTGNWTIGGGVGNSSRFTWTGTLPVTNSNNGGIFSTIFNSTYSSFMSTINMLESDSKARTLGRPSVLTLDNVAASLEDMVTRYVKVAGKDDVDLFKVESGTVLQVTPHIIEDPAGGPSFISMVVNIQSNDDSSSSVTASSADEVPPIKQTRINTQALVREGQSLLLGGYYVEYRKDGNSGLPGLKNVPVVGKLFGTDSDSSYQRERMILITPRILDIGQLQMMPQDLDNPEFSVSPTQADYLKRPPRPHEESGCSSNRREN